MKAILHTLFLFYVFVPHLLNAQIQDSAVQVYFLKINPAGTYLFIDTKYDGYSAPSSMDLLSLYNNQNIKLQVGDLIGFEQVGNFQPGVNYTDDFHILGAVFKGPTGFLFPGPLTTAEPFYSIPTDHRGIPTDIPEDFSIYFNSTVYAQIPEGATQVLFSVNDSYFIDNSDPDGNFGVYVKLTIRKPKYRIEKTIQIIDTGLMVANTDVVSILPSNRSCSDIKPSRAQLFLKCIKINLDNSEVPADGCKVAASLSLGQYHAGHDVGHDLSIKPIGSIIPSGMQGVSVTIPIDGLYFQYEASDVAGEVNLNFDVLDPLDKKIDLNSTVFQAKIPDLVSLAEIPNLQFVNIKSHPNDGFYGTQNLKDHLTTAIQSYKANSVFAQNIPAGSVVGLSSEGASLIWGGVFDINRNWGSPHCGHRLGDTIDISTSPFNASPYSVTLKRQLKDALAKKQFRWPVRYESPQDPNSNHWHSILNN